MVEVDECAHNELAIHAVAHSSMPWNRVPEILYNCLFTFILTDLFKPEAKNPPKGPIVLANKEKTIKWACNLVMLNTPMLTSSSIGDLQMAKWKGISSTAVNGHRVPPILWIA